MKRIFLIGMPACGKTYWGKILADKHKLPLVDLDDYIEDDACMTIPNIFKKEGEDGFRNRETRALKIVCHEYSNFIMACGGGTPCYFENMDLIIKEGSSIYLRATAQILRKRISDQLKHRPLLDNLDDNHLVEFLQETMDLRENFYRKATHILEPHEQSLHNFEEIISSL